MVRAPAAYGGDAGVSGEAFCCSCAAGPCSYCEGRL